MISFTFLLVFGCACQVTGSQEEMRLTNLQTKRGLHFGNVLKKETEAAERASCTGSTLAHRRPKDDVTSPQHLNFLSIARRQKRDVDEIRSPYGTATVFSGTAAALKFTGRTALPNHQFSVAVWVKPEGGQKVPVNILGNGFLLFFKIYNTALFWLSFHQWERFSPFFCA